MFWKSQNFIDGTYESRRRIVAGLHTTQTSGSHANMAKDNVFRFVAVDELPRPKPLQFKTTEDRILFAKGTFRESKVSLLVRFVTRFFFFTYLLQGLPNS